MSEYTNKKELLEILDNKYLLLLEQVIEMLRHCEAESHCYDGIHGTCKGCNKRIALDMAIEALQFVEHFNLLKELQSLQEVVWCKDCQHANECHKSIQYTRNEPNTVIIGYSPIEWCSKGERSKE